MTQPHLLELAKQGDPSAIAALMNVTLEPQGVTAMALLDTDCLSVFLTAARPLKAQTLVAFVQRGILRLEVASIRQVQVYGQCVGEAQPAWVETFAIEPPLMANALQSAPQSTNAPQAAEALALETLAHGSNSHSSKSYGSRSHQASEPPLGAHASSADHATQTEPLTQLEKPLKPSLQASCNNAFVSLGATVKQTIKQTVKQTVKQVFAQLPWRGRPVPATADHAASNALPAPSVNYLKLSALVTVLAFVTGGAVALIANSYTLGNADRKADSKAAIASGSQMAVKAAAERTRNQQQTAAKQYLETMNKAQQAFYRQNQRFATTLEELERFAAVPIAIRSDYTYKLTAPSSTQAQLTAVPKAEGLRSYTAAAAIVKPTNRVVTAICASQQAAKVPPLIFQSTSGAVQCPAEPGKTS